MISAKSERPEKHVLELMKWLKSETIEQIIYPRSHDVGHTTNHSKNMSWPLFNAPIKEKEQSTVTSNFWKQIATSAANVVNKNSRNSGCTF